MGHHECDPCPNWRPITSRAHFSSIPMFGGRPERDCVITKEDIIDLKIFLYTSKTLPEFLSHV